MAGISPIVTVGFLFSPSLIVTAGFLSGDAPPPVVVTGERGGWVPDEDKRNRRKKKQVAPWQVQDEASVRQSLMAVVEASATRKRELEDAQDLDDLIRLMEKMGL